MEARMDRLLAAGVLAFTLGAPGSARAQGVVAGSFDQLRMLARLGETITVTDASGTSRTGTLASLSPTTLSLLVGRTRRDLAEADVRRVTGRTHASLAAGAKIGFSVGASLGLLAGLALANECSDGCVPFVPIAALTYGGLGAGVGVGIAAMTPRYPVLYDAGRPATGPAAGPDERGTPAVGLAFRF
jgi:hypothetical protein